MLPSLWIAILHYIIKKYLLRHFNNNLSFKFCMIWEKSCCLQKMNYTYSNFWSLFCNGFFGLKSKASRGFAPWTLIRGFRAPLDPKSDIRSLRERDRIPHEFKNSIFNKNGPWVKCLATSLPLWTLQIKLEIGDTKDQKS